MRGAAGIVYVVDCERSAGRIRRCEENDKVYRGDDDGPGTGDRAR